LWIVILMEANHEENRFIWKGESRVCKRGEFITSRKALAELSHLNSSNVERCLNYLEIEHQIEQQSTTKYRLIKVINYDTYQSCEQQNEQQANSKRTASEHKQEYKNVRIKEIYTSINKEKEIVEKEKPKKLSLADGIKTLQNITPELMQDYLEKFPILTAERINKEGESAADWLASKGQPYSDYNAFFRNWLRRVADRTAPSAPVKKRFELENLDKYAIVQKRIDAEQEQYRNPDYVEPQKPKTQ